MAGNGNNEGLGYVCHEYAQAKERENYTVQQWAEYEQQQLHRLLVHALRMCLITTNPFPMLVLMLIS